MKILTDPEFFTEHQIKFFEKKYKAKFILESSIRTKGGAWTEYPSAIFYNKVKHPQGSNYFAITKDNCVFDSYLISNAISMTNIEFFGIRDNVEDVVVYSRYRHDYRTTPSGDNFIDGGHDYRTTPSGDNFIDGGRDYCRCSDTSKLVTFRINIEPSLNNLLIPSDVST